MSQTRKRCPTGFHKNRANGHCDRLEPCYVHPEEQIYRNFIETINQVTAQNAAIKRGLTQRVHGALPSTDLPAAHMAKYRLGMGAANITYSVPTRKTCADKKTYPKYIARITQAPVTGANTIENWKKSARLIADLSIDGVSPKLFDMVYQQDKKVALVMEYYPSDLQMYLHGKHYKPEHKQDIFTQIHEQITYIIYTISERGAFCIDIKPENTVIRDTTPKQKKNQPPVAPSVDVRFIDFDDWCSTQFTTHQLSEIHSCSLVNPVIDKNTVAFYLMYTMYMMHLDRFDAFFMNRRPMQIPDCVFQLLPIFMMSVPHYLQLMNHYMLIPPPTRQNSYLRSCRKVVSTLFRPV